MRGLLWRWACLARIKTYSLADRWYLLDNSPTIPDCTVPTELEWGAAAKRPEDFKWQRPMLRFHLAESQTVPRLASL